MTTPTTTPARLADLFVPSANPGFLTLAEGAATWANVYAECQRAGLGLASVQREHQRRQLVGAQLVLSSTGWSVRYLSGLDGFGLLASSRTREVDGTLEDAVRYATEWVQRGAAQGQQRYVLVRVSELRAEEAHRAASAGAPFQPMP